MRALVSMFAILLIGISVYQLSFTWFVNSHESAMKEKAKRYVKNFQMNSVRVPTKEETSKSKSGISSVP